MIKQLLAPRGRLQRMDRRIKPLLLQRAVEMQLHIARALKFLENHLVHPAAGLDQRRCKNCQAAAFFGIARGAEEFFRLDQPFRLDTAGHDPPFAWLHIIITARQPRYAVEQYHDVLFHLDQTLRALQHQLRHLHMSMYVFIEVRMINLAIDFPLNVGHFFGTLVHQEQNENNLGVICADSFRDLLEQNRFPHPWRRDDQPALPSPQRRQKIDRPRADRVRLCIFQHDPALWKLRS